MMCCGILSRHDGPTGYLRRLPCRQILTPDGTSPWHAVSRDPSEKLTAVKHLLPPNLHLFPSLVYPILAPYTHDDHAVL